MLGFNYDTGERYLSIEGFLPPSAVYLTGAEVSGAGKWLAPSTLSCPSCHGGGSSKRLCGVSRVTNRPHNCQRGCPKTYGKNGGARELHALSPNRSRNGMPTTSGKRGNEPPPPGRLPLKYPKNRHRRCSRTPAAPSSRAPNPSRARPATVWRLRWWQAARGREKLAAINARSAARDWSPK